MDGYVVGKITWIHDACSATALESLGSESDTSPTFADWLNQVEAAMAPTNGQEGSDRRPKSGHNTPESAIAELLCAVGGQRPVWSLSANPISPGLQKAQIAKVVEIRPAGFGKWRFSSRRSTADELYQTNPVNPGNWIETVSNRLWSYGSHLEGQGQLE